MKKTGKIIGGDIASPPLGKHVQIANYKFAITLL